MNKPHIHAALIKNWADGAVIQYYCKSTGAWMGAVYNSPDWNSNTKYRVAPEAPEKVWANVYRTNKVCLGNSYETKSDAYDRRRTKNYIGTFRYVLAEDESDE